MGPSALSKAASLHHFAEAQGSPLSTFELVLSEPEAMELLDWYGAQYSGTNDCFDLDFEEAQLTHDPWPILSQFVLMGFRMIPLGTLQ